MLAEGTILDLSTRGWQIASTQVVQRGTPLSLRIALPDGQDPIDVELATVRWSAQGKFGLKHMVLGEGQWKRLRRFVFDRIKHEPAFAGSGTP